MYIYIYIYNINRSIQSNWLNKHHREQYLNNINRPIQINWLNKHHREKLQHKLQEDIEHFQILSSGSFCVERTGCRTRKLFFARFQPTTTTTKELVKILKQSSL